VLAVLSRTLISDVNRERGSTLILRTLS
jgi:hypothetical protein